MADRASNRPDEGNKQSSTGSYCANPECMNQFDRTTLRRCSKCQAAYYCSSECQTVDWPSHKVACKKPSEEAEKDQKRQIMHTLMSCSQLRPSFELLAVMQHDLHLLDDAELKKRYASKPVALTVYVQFEPAHPRNVLRLLSSASTSVSPGASPVRDHTPMASVPQVLASGYPTDAELGAQPHFLELFRRARDNGLAGQTPDAATPPLIVVMRVEQWLKMAGHDAGEAHSQKETTCFPITNRTLKIARQWREVPVAVPVDMGHVTDQPMVLTLNTHMETINGAIRHLNAQNEVRLRSRLPDWDRKLLSLVRVQPPASAKTHPYEYKFADFWRQKLAREYVYHLAAEKYKFDKEILPEPFFIGHVRMPKQVVEESLARGRRALRGEGDGEV